MLGISVHNSLAVLTGGAAVEAIFVAYLDALPSKFGSAKLAHEADLVLAALAAAELAHAASLKALAPTRFVVVGEDPVTGEPRLAPDPESWAAVGGLESDWQGAPLCPLAEALGRSRLRRNVDDEVYSATFIYVLFRLKAALGVWRGGGAPDARYRLWLKDLAPLIAIHPRLGPKVTLCHGLIGHAVCEAARAYLEDLATDDRSEPPSVFRAFAATAQFHAEAAGLKVREVLPVLDDALEEAGIQAVRQGQNAWALTCFTAQLALWADGHIPPAAPTAWNDLAGTYIQRGVAKQSVEGQGLRAAIEDYEQGVAIRLSLRALLEPRGVWDLPLRNDLALAYSNRGNAKLSAAGHGPEASIDDYDRAIAIRLGLRALLEPDGAWDPPLRNSLAGAYMNRGVAKLSAEGHGPRAAIADYDEAIGVMRALRALLEPRGEWDPSLRNDLANAYMNRANAMWSAGGLGSRAALEDYDRAIEIRLALRALLEPEGAWEPPLQNDLARAYMNRGNAKQDVEGHGPQAAIEDYRHAIGIMLALRARLEPKGVWDPPLRNDLARAYANRGVAKLDAEQHGPSAAIADFDLAIGIMLAQRRFLEPKGAWDPALRNDLASAYMNRGNAKRFAEGHGPGAAIGDYDLAIGIGVALRALLEPKGAWVPPLRNDLAGAYMNRGRAKWDAEGHEPQAAIGDYDLAIGIMLPLRALLEPRGAWDPPYQYRYALVRYNRAVAASALQDRSTVVTDAGQAELIAQQLIGTYGAASDPQWYLVSEAAERLLFAASGHPKPKALRRRWWQFRRRTS